MNRFRVWVFVQGTEFQASKDIALNVIARDEECAVNKALWKAQKELGLGDRSLKDFKIERIERMTKPL